MCQTLGNKRSRTSSLTLLRPPPKPVHQPEGCTVSHPTTGRASNWHGRGAGRGQGRGARAALKYMGKRMKDGKGAASGRKRHLSYPALKERYVVFGFACCFVFKQKFLKRSRLHTNQFLIRKNLILSAPGTAERIITTPPTRARPSAGFAHRRGTPVSESHPFFPPLREPAVCPRRLGGTVGKAQHAGRGARDSGAWPGACGCGGCASGPAWLLRRYRAPRGRAGEISARGRRPAGCSVCPF